MTPHRSRKAALSSWLNTAAAAALLFLAPPCLVGCGAAEDGQGPAADFASTGAPSGQADDTNDGNGTGGAENDIPADPCDYTMQLDRLVANDSGVMVDSQGRQITLRGVIVLADCHVPALNPVNMD